MKAKTINSIIVKKIDEWLESIDDVAVRDKAKSNTIVTGGCIASMLLNEPVNDYDIYFRNRDAAESVARYYAKKFSDKNDCPVGVSVESDRIRITTETGHRGETAGDVVTLGHDDVEEGYYNLEESALDDGGEQNGRYRPVFMSTNAITLSNRVQIVIRFFGDPKEIHDNYDFVHCTNYWTGWDRNVVLNQPALESLLSKELRYVGSKYPLCSIIRLRKFIKRGWTVNAGQILKAVMQLNELDLTKPDVLEDQLTGVDSAYFLQLMIKLRENDPEKVNSAYLVEIIDRMF